MSLKQLSTVIGDGLDMCEVNNGQAPVVSVSMYRHAADHDAGNANSWFIEVKAELTGTYGQRCRIGFVHRTTLKHGMSKEVCGAFASSVLVKGKINMKFWKVQCNH